MISTQDIINKEHFVKNINNNYVHDKLIDMFYESYATDPFYNEVDSWYNMDLSQYLASLLTLVNYRSWTKSQTLNRMVDKGFTLIIKVYYFI